MGVLIGFILYAREYSRLDKLIITYGTAYMHKYIAYIVMRRFWLVLYPTNILMKLWGLKKWTLINRNGKTMEFLWVDGMYCRWKYPNWEIIIMWHANQDVSEYREIID